MRQAVGLKESPIDHSAITYCYRTTLDTLYLWLSDLQNFPPHAFGAQLISPIQRHVKRHISSLCIFFSGHRLDFLLPVSDKICHSPFKNVNIQTSLIISLSQHSQFFEGQSEKIKLKSHWRHTLPEKSVTK